MMKRILQKIRGGMHRERGIVLVAAMLAITGLMAIGVMLSTGASGSSKTTRRDYHHERAFHVAEGGADYAQSWLFGVLALNRSPSQEQLDILPSLSVSGFQFDELRIHKRPVRENVLITRGPNMGLRAKIQPYEIVSRAGNRSTKEEVRVTVNHELIGLYQYGIFYANDLELFPSFPLDYMGRIHTNGNLYVGSRNTLDLNTQLTSAGSVYKTAKDRTMLLNGKARFLNADGTWRDLSYDSTDPDWIQKSIRDWDGNVQDQAHGVTELPFPIPVTSDPHDIIEPPVMGEPLDVQEKKYYYKAGLRIINGEAKDSLGNTVTLPAGVITSSSVYDYREQRTMEMRNLNVGALIASGLVPANNVIYVSHSHSNAALRIRNAAALPTGGLVIVTDNPAYVQGNYNTINKQPSSIMCDAFNVYSNIWSDANATQDLNKRVASATTVNTAVVTGNKSTTDGNYGGGAENLIRMHEKWVGHQLTFRGSLICLWESEQATGSFRNASYVEAQRDWAFDPDLLDPNFWPEDDLAVSHIVRGRWVSH